MDLTNYLQLKCALVEERLSLLVPEKELLYNQLFQAARYSLLSSAKRLRPILTLATVEAFGGNLEAALTPACTLEMIHTYSLIHDDLPCMDDDDFRRGRPSLHKAFSEGCAVLAGDFLLTHAFAVLAKSSLLSAEQKIALIDTLAERAGGDGMIAGQMMDIEAEGKEVELEELKMIHQKKTGAMIVAAFEFGGIIANISKQEMLILQKIGQELGLAFQIVDDILDVTESEQKHGKTTASDVANGKKTYVSLLGLDQSQKLAQSLLDSALQRLKSLAVDTSLLSGLAERIVYRNH